MPPRINKAELDAVTVLPPAKRYEYFIKKVADREEAWGLFQDGWAISENNNHGQLFPLWPAKEYAAACAVGLWEKYEPKSLSVDYLIGELLPMLEGDGVLPGVFFTNEQGSVEVSCERLLGDLRSELEKYG